MSKGPGETAQAQSRLGLLCSHTRSMDFGEVWHLVSRACYACALYVISLCIDDKYIIAWVGHFLIARSRSNKSSTLEVGVFVYKICV